MDEPQYSVCRGEREGWGGGGEEGAGGEWSVSHERLAGEKRRTLDIV